MIDIPQEKNVAPRFRGEIVRRVYRVWLVRKLLPVLLLEIGIISFGLYWLGRAIFLQNVVNNALTVFLNRPAGSISFLAGAFGNAPWLTKFLGTGVIVLLALFLRHITQGFLRLILVKENYFSRIQK